mgnify:CR=1 FL=1
MPAILTAASRSALPIRVGVIGTGGRGSGAAVDALKAADDVQIVALAEANRIFGFDGWDRRTLTTRCVWTGMSGKHYCTAYTARP